ncbi:MAG: hypothetical protein CR993_01960 [Rhodobacterales bacterium]|nr:MAG: hypothetical protein CR993_01960 [Rhodobacterales bacterium]
MTSRSLILITAAFAFAAPVAAHADVFSEHFLSKYDANGDGAVSLEEVKKKRTRGFGKWDANGDGQLDPNEYGALKAHHATQEALHRSHGMADIPGKVHDAMHVYVMDTNRDGMTSAEEFLAASVAWFKSVDTDGDGRLTAEELDAI